MTDVDDLVVWLSEVLDQERQRWLNPWEGPDSQRRSGLARVEAERAVVALHRPRGVQGGPPYRWTCVVCDHAPVDWEAYGDYPCCTLRWLAWGHQFDAPGWQTAWAPEGVEAQA